MPGYIRGLVERGLADRWEFICRVDPFTGSQGDFKYVFFGTGWASALEPVVHTPGLPDDMASNTKLVMMGGTSNALERLSNQNLDEQFETFQENMSEHTPPRYVSLEKLLEFDWDSGISDENRTALAEHGANTALHRVLRLFKLVDSDGNKYSEWTAERENEWRGQFADWEDSEALLRGEWVELEDRWVSLQPRPRRELLPDDWFDLLQLLYREDDYRDVRFIFYWHH